MLGCLTTSLVLEGSFRTLAKCPVASLGYSQPWAPTVKRGLLPRHLGCKASLSLPEQSLPRRKCLHPTPLCRCAGELTAALQACPAHLNIHSSTTLSPSPGLEDKRGACRSWLTEPPSACCPALFFLCSTSRPLVPTTLAPLGASHHVSPVECVLPERGQP